MKGMKFKKIFTCTMAAVFLAASDGWTVGEVSNEVLNEMKELRNIIVDLKNTVERQNEKIARLEKRQADIQVPISSQPEAEANKWLKDLKFGGDFRLRYEGFDFTSGNPAETDPRNRFRFRLRYGFEKKFSDEFKIGFAMASGEQVGGTNVDPTSTNVSFDNLFNFKDIFIEKAYATYLPQWAKAGPVEGLEITGGKFTNPFERGSSDIIWDRDVKPEGLYEKLDFKLIQSDDLDVNAFLTAGQFILEEDGTLGSGTIGGDAELFAFQLGVNPVVHTPFLERPVDITQAVSFYSYPEFASQSNFLINGTSLARGNSNAAGSAAELDAGDFQVIESYTELAVFPYGFPARFYFDIAANPADDTSGNTIVDENLAYALGVRLGGLSKKGDWELSYAYKYIDANAVVGAFNDSDFGLGHSGKRGNVFKLGYALTDNLTLNGAAFFVENSNDIAGLRDEQQRRFQADLSWKF